MMQRPVVLYVVFLAAALAVFALVWGGAYGIAIAPDVPQEVAAGFAAWRDYGCEGCHTLYGQGGVYAPDLTHIMGLRGETYLREFMVNPAAFHPGQRLMPRFSITQGETDSIIALLRWTDSTTAVNWPPRPIQVAGSGGFVDTLPQTESTSGDPILAQGRTLFGQYCASCHSLEPDVVLTGPSLAGIADRAWYRNRVVGQGPDDYIRNSILYPSDYLVEGYPDVMQKNFADTVSSAELDALVAFLMTLEEAE